MDDKRHVKVSKFLSLVLRHQPSAAGVTLDAGGWVAVDDLLAGCAAAGRPCGRAELERVVADSDKQRFALSPDGLRIRASQGHSVPVDLGLADSEPPPVLYHGTATRTLPLVLREGLRPMGRQDVHLSADAATATRVGARHGRPVVLEIDAAALAAAGHRFRVSANGVWLTDAVPASHLRVPPTG
ncbi:RNA 2'-phosphotransferase [Streptomyces sp. SL13]|uniref:Probable RNA 2'-phosphotransferase n=1 Tax=Streptantibioticus silvisoli TaxID=2705255 RepID=A0AA90KB58_9ACTN|nr:RNA 2'-phosphotransferase [Streptantibioticus silvisoli]MDI5963082.1 RNA 2'-phosphotransferase [Streptantibioticus silvisoli]MDI5973228.1 RNA 2'-phosphotransferase [Streptantibioticus silvisoli]